MKFIYDLHRTMLKKELILIYEGEFTQDVTKSVLAMAERNMDSYNEDGKVKRKVFNVMMECLQNIVRHADNFEPERKVRNNAVFMIGKHEREYYVTSGNAIPNDDVQEMGNKLERINSMDTIELKELYKKIIKNGKIDPVKGGAGLGFVDMARKSGRKLIFDFEPIDDTLTFFSFKATIPRTI
ncbi:MAG: hypothetical protein ACJAWV_001218 [Flammeovirgaceae bacterium]|jgi:hypothetical protein